MHTNCQWLVTTRVTALEETTALSTDCFIPYLTLFVVVLSFVFLYTFVSVENVSSSEELVVLYLSCCCFFTTTFSSVCVALHGDEIFHQESDTKLCT